MGKKLDKRPFCNAFTGCGRKRAAGPVARGPWADELRSKLEALFEEDTSR